MKSAWGSAIVWQSERSTLQMCSTCRQQRSSPGQFVCGQTSHWETNQEQRSTTKSVNHTSPKPRFTHVNHENETVKLVLVVGTVDTNVLKDVVQVISCQTSAGKLGKDTTAKTEEDTFAISLCELYQYATKYPVRTGNLLVAMRSFHRPLCSPSLIVACISANSNCTNASSELPLA